MGSQIDLDQGGTIRQYQKLWLGPTIGWVDYPTTAILSITAAGVYTISRGTNLIQININGNVTINLPSSKASAAGAVAIPGNSIVTPVVISDLGGFAAGATYNIVPFGSELISGLASVQLASPFGTILLEPNTTSGGWNLGQ
jgi:hypothetical protein